MSNYFDQKTSFMEPTVTQYGSRMVMTNVIKSKIKKIINFDTRFSDNTEIEFSFNLPERINNVTQIKVAQIEIPVSFYNISTNLRNNFFILKDITNNTITKILIPDGNYSQETFILKLTSLLTNITFLIDSNNICSFTNTSSSLLLLDFTINSDGTICKNGLENLIQSLFGFKESTILINPNSTIKTEKCFNINTIRYLFLTMEDFVNSTHNGFIGMLKNSTINKKILARIPFDKTLFPFGTIIQGKLTDCIRLYHGPVDLQRFKLQLVNEYGLPIQLNGGSFSFSLEIEMEE